VEPKNHLPQPEQVHNLAKCNQDMENLMARTLCLSATAKGNKDKPLFNLQSDRIVLAKTFLETG
jgi:hypothetical protein